MKLNTYVTVLGLVLYGCLGLFGGAPTAAAAEDLEMRVAGVAADPHSRTPIVVLKDIKGTVAFPIWIGLNEAQAIMMELEGVQSPRPLTHDLTKNMLERLEGKIDKVTVTDLRDQTFYARITLTSNGKSHTIDSRPSDAIALALRFKAPIFVNVSLLKQASAVNLMDSGRNDDTRRRFGITVQNLTPALVEALGMEAVEGVLIANVDGRNRAPADGLQRGDVIVEVDGTKVRNVEELNRLFHKLAKVTPLPLAIRRGKERVSVKLLPLAAATKDEGPAVKP